MSDLLSDDLPSDADGTVENMAVESPTSTCPACGTENPVGYTFCSQCGTALSNASPPSDATPRDLAKGRTRKRRIFAISSLLVSLALVGWWMGHKPNPDANEATDANAVDATASPISEPKAPSIKQLWEQGATAKRERRFADAAVAWTDILATAPDHPGIQPAIDKLPVEVGYIVEAMGTDKGKCDIAYLDQRQRRQILRDVPLPWKLNFLARKGQRLSISAAYNRPNLPIGVTAFVENRKIMTVSSLTQWWLGMPSNIQCDMVADYQNPRSGVRGTKWVSPKQNPQGEPQDEAKHFRERVKAELEASQSDLVLGATIIDNTDLLMVTLGFEWEEMSTAARLRLARRLDRIWQDERHPRWGMQSYILFVGKGVRIVGGSQFPDSGRIWVVNRGAQGKPLPDVDVIAPADAAKNGDAPGGGGSGSDAETGDTSAQSEPSGDSGDDSGGSSPAGGSETGVQTPGFRRPYLWELIIGTTLYNVEGGVYGTIADKRMHRFEDGEEEVAVKIRLNPEMIERDGEPYKWLSVYNATRVVRLKN